MKPESKKRSRLTIVLFAVYMLLLTGVILFKLPFSEPFTDIRAINLIPFQGSLDGNGSLVWREIVSNILVFMPLGIYICLLQNSWPFIKKLLPIIGATLVFEIIQFAFAMGRTDITDFLGNTLGGIIGIGIAVVAFRVLKGRTIRIANLFALVVTVCVVLYFAYLFYLNHFAMRYLAP